MHIYLLIDIHKSASFEIMRVKINTGLLGPNNNFPNVNTKDWHTHTTVFHS